MQGIQTGRMPYQRTLTHMRNLHEIGATTLLNITRAKDIGTSLVGHNTIWEMNHVDEILFPGAKRDQQETSQALSDALGSDRCSRENPSSPCLSIFGIR